MLVEELCHSSSSVGFYGILQTKCITAVYWTGVQSQLSQLIKMEKKTWKKIMEERKLNAVS